MLNFRTLALLAGLPTGVLGMNLATVLVLRGLEGAPSWTSSTVSDIVVGFLLFAVGAVSVWLSTRRAPRSTPGITLPSRGDATNEEGMKRLRETFRSPWSASPREEPSRRTAER